MVPLAQILEFLFDLLPFDEIINAYKVVRAGYEGMFVYLENYFASARPGEVLADLADDAEEVTVDALDDANLDLFGAAIDDAFSSAVTYILSLIVAASSALADALEPAINALLEKVRPSLPPPRRRAARAAPFCTV